MAKGFFKRNKGKIALAAIAIVIVAWGFATNWKFLAPTPTPTPVAATKYELAFAYYNNKTAIDADDVTSAWYEADVSDMTAAEIEDLVWADFTLNDADANSLEPEAGYVYVVKITANGFDSQYITTDARVGTSVLDAMPVIVLGTNTINLMFSCTDVSMAAYSIQGVAVNLTNDRNWDINTYTLDAAEGTGELSTAKGYLPYIDFENGHNERFVLRVKFNATAALSWCEFQSPYESSESASTTYLYYEIDAVLLGTDTFEIRLGSTIGVDFEADSIQVGHGSAADFTQWDTQA